MMITKTLTDWADSYIKNSGSTDKAVIQKHLEEMAEDAGFKDDLCQRDYDTAIKLAGKLNWSKEDYDFIMKS